MKENILKKRNGWLGWWPNQGFKAILDPENARIVEFLKEQRKLISDNSIILDAGV